MGPPSPRRAHTRPAPPRRDLRRRRRDAARHQRRRHLLLDIHQRPARPPRPRQPDRHPLDPRDRTGMPATDLAITPPQDRREEQGQPMTSVRNDTDTSRQRVRAVRSRFHPRRTPPMVLRRLPPIRLATPPGRTPTHPTRQDRHRLRMPAMPDPLPRRPTLRGLQHLVPTPGPGRPLPALRRLRRRQRSRRRQPIRRCPCRAAGDDTMIAPRCRLRNGLRPFVHRYSLLPPP